MLIFPYPFPIPAYHFQLIVDRHQKLQRKPTLTPAHFQNSKEVEALSAVHQSTRLMSLNKLKVNAESSVPKPYTLG